MAQIYGEQTEESVERQVMGDRYSSLYANGEEEPKPSLWQHFAYPHPTEVHLD